MHSSPDRDAWCKLRMSSKQNSGLPLQFNPKVALVAFAYVLQQIINTMISK